jgi:hypothetical protein
MADIFRHASAFVYNSRMNTPESPSNLDQNLDTLRGFVAESEQQAGYLLDFQGLQAIVRPEVTLALSHVILEVGHPPSKAAHSSVMAELETRQGKTKLQALVTNGPGTEPSGIHLDEMVRHGLRRYSSNRVASLTVSGDVGLGMVARDSEGYYLPSTASDEFINFRRDTVVRSRLYPNDGVETDADLNNLIIAQSSHTLNGFLRVTAQLTSQLLDGISRQ